MRFTFFSLWLVGLICFIGLIVSVSKDFRTNNTLNEEEIALINPRVSRLEIISPGKKFHRNHTFRFEPFTNVEEDTVSIENISVHIVKSPNDSFRVTMLKMVNGSTRRAADTLAALMQFNVLQDDSLLLIDKGIPVTRKDKFRNQRVVLTIYVPVGKQIRIDRNVGWSKNVSFGPWGDNYDVDFDDVEDGWDTNVDYIMRADGLYTLNGEPADKWKNRNRKITTEINGERSQITTSNDEEDNNYRYDNTTPQLKLDSLKQKLQQEQIRIKDSLKKAKDKIEKELQKIGDIEELTEPTAMINSFPAYNPLVIMN